MTEQTTNPHAEMITFIENYEELIKPNLEKGNLDGVKFLIGDACIRFGYFETSKDKILAKKGAYPRYRMAMTYLSGLFDKKEIDQRSLNRIVLSIDRYVAELGLFLSDDPGFIKMRERNSK